MSEDAGQPLEISQDELTTHLAQGEAAWMLLECLMLALSERSVVTRDEFIRSVETVIATKQQMIVDRQHPHIASVAVGLLTTMANSLASGKGEGES